MSNEEFLTWGTSRHFSRRSSSSRLLRIESGSDDVEDLRWPFSIAQGSVGTLTDSVAALCLQSAHGYHAGSVRQQLIQRAFQTVVYYPSIKVYQLAQARVLVSPARVCPPDDPAPQSPKQLRAAAERVAISVTVVPQYSCSTCCMCLLP